MCVFDKTNNLRHIENRYFFSLFSEKIYSSFRVVALEMIF